MHSKNDELEEVYMKQHEGFIVKENNTINQIILRNGFKINHSNKLTPDLTTIQNRLEKCTYLL